MFMYVFMCMISCWALKRILMAQPDPVAGLWAPNREFGPRSKEQHPSQALLSSHRGFTAP